MNKKEIENHELNEKQLSAISGGVAAVVEKCPKCGSKNVTLELRDPRHCGEHHCSDCGEYF